jgi:2',3'-cyclic-nucleotide 2'-phosphodiesterase (5'-nucleotidase family)
MSKPLWFLGILLLALPARATAQAESRVTIVATSDVHGRVTAWDYFADRASAGGLTRLARLVDSLRERGEAVVLVDAGDFLQGNPLAMYAASEQRFPVHPIVEAYNALAYDAVTLGEHDLDFGVDVLDTALIAAQFRVVAANYFDATLETPVYEDVVVVERNGIRVGITGFTPPGAAARHRGRLPNRDIRPVGEVASGTMARMVSENAHVRLALFHGDVNSGPEDTRAAALAQLRNAPHVTVFGHSHRPFADTTVGRTRFVRPGSFAREAAIIRITLRPGADGRPTPVQISTERVSLGALTPDPVADRRLDPAHRAVRAWTNQVVSTSRTAWDGRFVRAEDTPLIDLLNELQRRVAGAELSVTPAFAPGVGLPAGEIRRRDLLALYPHEYTLVAVRIDGATLHRYLEQSAAYFATYGPDASPFDPSVSGLDFDIMSGVEYVIDLTRPAGERIRQLVFRGQLVDSGDVFTLAMNDARYRGVGRYGLLADLPAVYANGERIRDLLVGEVRRSEVLEPEDYFERNWRVIPDEARTALRDAFGAQPVVAEDRIVLRVLATTDFNGALTPRQTTWSEGRWVGGAQALRELMDSLATICECATFRLDAGDHLQGSLVADGSYGRDVVEAFNTIGFDGTTVGQRDLDWGLDTLRARIGDAEYPWLVANAWLADRRSRPEWARPWTMVERNGVRVALIGVTGASAPTVGARGAADAVAFEDMTSGVVNVLSQVRAANPDYVVVLAHAPTTCDQHRCDGGLVELAEGLPASGVDLIVGGHSDLEATTVVNGIPILLPGSYGLSLGVVDIVQRADGTRQVAPRFETVWADRAVAAASARESDALVAPAPEPPVATLKFAAPIGGPGESALGRLMADASRNAARTQIAMVRLDELISGLPAGAVSRQDVFRIRDTPRPLKRVSLTGRQVVSALEQTLTDTVPTVAVAGIVVTYDPTRSVGQRVLEVRFSDGRPVELAGTYTVAVTDLLAAGAAGMHLLAAAATEDVGVSDLDALVQYLGRLPQPVDVPAEARYRIER